MPVRTLPLVCLPLLLSACGSGDDPQLAMCQAVAKQLVGDGVASWERVEQVDGGRSRHVQIDYATASGGSGSIDCAYPINQDGAIATAPDRVQLDGQPVEQKVLISAGLKASGELLAGTAAETVARTKEFADEAGDTVREVAGQAGERAREVAGQALGSAVEAGKTLQDKLDQ